MKRVKAANPSHAQHHVLFMASKQLSRKKMVNGGSYLELCPRGRGR